MLDRRRFWRLAQWACAAVLACSIPLLIWPQGTWAGHEVTYYPAFYPSEINLTTLSPAAAGSALAANKLQVFVGSTPRFTGAVPTDLRSASSVGSYVALDLDPRAPGLAGRAARCAAAADLQAALAGAAQEDFVFHPFPVTPFHEDFIAFADQAESARLAAQKQTKARRTFAIRAQGPLAQRLAAAGWSIVPETAAAPAALVALPADQVLAPTRFSGWAGPPWVKEGWYEAWQVLSPGMDGKTLSAARPLAQKLMRGQFNGLVERYNLERRLVAALLQPCTRVVVGYELRQEYTNDNFTYGIENIASDSTLGLNNPVFIRTVKLKDYPWNGPLFVATAEAPKAAWNPVSGFSDVAGRFVWSVVADDAYMSVPENSSWLPNRMDPLATEVQLSPKSGIKVPPDALLPEPGTGIMKPVGAGKISNARIMYRVLSSPFMDGSETQPEDLLYPYTLAYRWGGGTEAQRDPAVAEATALVRERLVGIRIAGTRRTVDNQAGVEVPKVVHLVEVFLNHSASDSRQVAALAPPWSAVPWELLALMEEAVGRGMAAFSQSEAQRRAVPWLDLVRDPALQQKLRGLIAEFQQSRYRPPAIATGGLADLVTAEQAGARWAALGKFAAEHGHLLDTNGAYVLKQWADEKIQFEVVRNFSYAVGLGTYNTFADASSARVTALNRKGRRVVIDSELEIRMRAQRDLVVTREPFREGAARGFRIIPARAELVVIGPDGRVAAALQPAWNADGQLSAILPDKLAPGRYTLAAAVYADENAAQAGVRTLQVDIAAP